MHQQASDQFPGPDGGAWDAADAMLDAWIGTLNANADRIVAMVTLYTEWAAAAVAAMETAAAGLASEQKTHIQSGVDAILAAFPKESWIRASWRATDCLRPYPPLARLLTHERIRGLQDRFGWGIQAAVAAVVAQGVLEEDEQSYVELLTRPWRSAGLTVPTPPQRLGV
jgi:hypothetical protein